MDMYIYVQGFIISIFCSFIIICADQFILGIDMALRSFANHSIITYGTFAMWGALLSNKGEVVMSQDHVKTEVGRNIQKGTLVS